MNTHLEAKFLDLNEKPDFILNSEIILVYPSTTEVLNVEDCLDDLDLPFNLIPVPKEMNPNCGLAISIQGDNYFEIIDLLQTRGYRHSAAYLRQEGQFSVLNA